MDKHLLKSAALLLFLYLAISLILPNSSNTKSNHKSKQSAYSDTSIPTGDDHKNSLSNENDSSYAQYDEEFDSDESDDNENQHVYETLGSIRYRVDDKIPMITQKDLLGNSSYTPPVSSKESSQASSKEEIQPSSNDTATSDETSSESSSLSSSSSISSSSNISSDSSSTTSQPITEQDNNETAKMLSKKYNINIIIARTSADYNLPDKSNYIHDESMIKASLKTISYYLMYIPSGAFSELTVDTLVITESNIDNSLLLHDNNYLLIASSHYSSSTEIRSATYRILSNQFEDRIKESNVTLTLSKYNPTDFVYGTPSKTLIYDFGDSHTIFSGYFLNEAAQISEYADAVEIFYSLLNTPDQMHSIPSIARIYPKIAEVQALANELYPLLEIKR